VSGLFGLNKQVPVERNSQKTRHITPELPVVDLGRLRQYNPCHATVHLTAVLLPQLPELGLQNAITDSEA
jgi:hypothetical protein